MRIWKKKVVVVPKQFDHATALRLLKIARSPYSSMAEQADALDRLEDVLAESIRR